MFKLLIVATAAGLASGEVCTENTDCPSTTTYCKTVEGNNNAGQCLPALASGETCGSDSYSWTDSNDNRQCTGSLICMGDVGGGWDKTCMALKGTGAECSASGQCSSEFCDNHLKGYSSNGVCATRVSVGSQCSDPDTSTQQQCVDGSYCKGVLGESAPTTMTGTCTTQVAFEGVCVFDVECAADHTPAGQCVEQKCADALGSLVNAAVGIGTTILAVAIIIPILIICCCIAVCYLVMKKKKGGDDD